MKRLLPLLALWMALITGSLAQVQLFQLHAPGHADHPVRAYALGSEVFLPLESLEALGFDAMVRGEEVQVTLEDTRRNFGFRVFRGSQSVALRQFASAFGYFVEVDRPRNTAHLLSGLRTVLVGEGFVTIEGEQNIAPRLSTLANPNRLVIELRGAKLHNGTNQTVSSGVRVEQSRLDTVRITVPARGTFLQPSTTPGRRFTFRFSGNSPPEPIVPQPAVEPVPVPSPTAETELGAVTVTELTLREELSSPTAILFGLVGPGPLPVPRITINEPNVVEFLLPGVSGRLAAPESEVHEGVRVTSRIEGSDTVLRWEFERATGFEVWSDGTVVKIQLVRPQIADGKLAGKLIVIDAGHGGRDSGARGGDLQEKVLALNVARLMAEELQKQGARVIMTRRTDVFLPLSQRARIANDNSADLFISVHFNSSARPGPSGVITFFHGPSTVRELLARCIHNEIMKVAQLPNIGVWSDKRIYRSGFAVLRETRMPGVLLELGFINNARDRARIRQPEYHRAVAIATVKGIKTFLGENP